MHECEVSMDILQARLVVIAQEQQLAEVAQIRGDVVKAEWGNQIRNYVLHPYKMVRGLAPAWSSVSRDMCNST